jgi:hypothetical protein
MHQSAAFINAPVQVEKCRARTAAHAMLAPWPARFDAALI